LTDLSEKERARERARERESERKLGRWGKSVGRPDMEGEELLEELYACDIHLNLRSVQKKKVL
jgi:hypothetical protein